MTKNSIIVALAILNCLDKATYPNILKNIETRTDTEWSIGSLTATLTRLITWHQATFIVKGKTRFYSLTPSGKATLDRELRNLDRLRVN